eukprot:3314564-Amphidinium_carterae.1
MNKAVWSTATGHRHLNVSKWSQKCAFGRRVPTVSLHRGVFVSCSCCTVMLATQPTPRSRQSHINTDPLPKRPCFRGTLLAKMQRCFLAPLTQQNPRDNVICFLFVVNIGMLDMSIVIFYTVFITTMLLLGCVSCLYQLRNAESLDKGGEVLSETNSNPRV